MRVLRDYKNYFKLKAGIDCETVDDLHGKTSNFNGPQRYVAVIMDEMKIQSNLVFDKYSGDLIGFIDLGDPMANFSNLQEEDALASHALAFLVRECYHLNANSYALVTFSNLNINTRQFYCQEKSSESMGENYLQSRRDIENCIF